MAANSVCSAWLACWHLMFSAMLKSLQMRTLLQLEGSAPQHSLQQHSLPLATRSPPATSLGRQMQRHGQQSCPLLVTAPTLGPCQPRGKRSRSKQSGRNNQHRGTMPPARSSQRRGRIPPARTSQQPGSRPRSSRLALLGSSSSSNSGLGLSNRSNGCSRSRNSRWSSSSPLSGAQQSSQCRQRSSSPLHGEWRRSRSRHPSSSPRKHSGKGRSRRRFQLGSSSSRAGSSPRLCLAMSRRAAGSSLQSDLMPGNSHSSLRTQPNLLRLGTRLSRCSHGSCLSRSRGSPRLMPARPPQ